MHRRRALQVIGLEESAATDKRCVVDKQTSIEDLRQTIRPGRLQLEGHRQRIRVDYMSEVDDLQIGHDREVVFGSALDIRHDAVRRPESALGGDYAVMAAEDPRILEGTVRFRGDIIRTGIVAPAELPELDLDGARLRHQVLSRDAVDDITLEGRVRTGQVVCLGAAETQ